MNVTAISTATAVTVAPVAVAPKAAAPTTTAKAAAPTAAPTTAKAAAPATTYSSPIVTLDAQSGAIVLEYRNAATGVEEYQSPSEAALQYQQAQRLGTPGK